MYEKMKLIKTFSVCIPGEIPDGVLSAHSPVVLKGLVQHWPAVQSAKKANEDFVDYLKTFYGGALVNVAIGNEASDKRIFYNKDMDGFNYQRNQARLDEFLRDIILQEQADKKYLHYMDSAPVDYCLPGFRIANDLQIPRFSPRVSLWLGNETIVSAHYDIPDNIACVVAGKRRFVLFPPEQISNLYVGPLDFNPAGQAISMVDLKEPDFQRFPRYRQALDQAVVADLEPGDAIYIPSMWWHHVEGLASLNALINYWWSTPPTYLGSPLDAFNHALLSLRSLPLEQRKSWKNIFDYYIFEKEEHGVEHIPEKKLGLLDDVDEMSARRLRAMLLNRLNR